MSVHRCSTCSAELIPEANFCRQCGATVRAGSEVNASEEPTLTLNERVDDVTTQRLDPRATSPGRGLLRDSVENSTATASLPSNTPRRRPSTAIVGGLVVVGIIVVVTSIAIVRIGGRNTITDSTALIYPGAQTVMDMTGDDGRAIQLQTADSIDRVLAWYDDSLKPTKRMRLTSTSFVLRNQNVTATIATEGNKTNIIIKQSLTR